MTNGQDPALVFERPSGTNSTAGTHALIIGVGEYAFGQDRAQSSVGGDLRQLSSPPVSARAIADWFIGSFRNSERPLSSVSMLLSEANESPYQPQEPPGAPAVQCPRATLENVKKAARAWGDRLRSHQDNLAVFFFCGHGVSLGQRAALLLEDFGDPARAFEGAIDVDILRGTLRNSPATSQVLLLDCCRTDADNLYQNELTIGSRILSESATDRGHGGAPQQFVLFPTIDGEEAFGIKDSVSVFTQSVIDALTFAAADASTGQWRTTTGKLLDEVNRLIAHRVPKQLRSKTSPNAIDASSFVFNEIDEPATTRSYVTISDIHFWSDDVELECADTLGLEPSQAQTAAVSPNETCCSFLLKEGKWRFTGSLPNPPPSLKDQEQVLRLPVAYVTLEVV